MALQDKNIVITPSRGQTAEPKIDFSAASSTLGPQKITITAYPTNNGTLSFDGSVGQLFQVSNVMSGQIYSVNDISGIPSIEVLDTGLVKLAQYSGNVLIGTATDNTTDKLQVSGNISATTYKGNWDSSGRNYSREWIEFPNASGLYSPRNSAHFFPNDGQYGSWKVQGTRNGYAGFEFSDFGISQMVNSNLAGFHLNGAGWMFRWQGGTIYCHKGAGGGGTEAVVVDSSNVASYAQAPLVSSTNIKTINGNSILGSGDLVVAAAGGISASDAMAIAIALG